MKRTRPSEEFSVGCAQFEVPWGGRMDTEGKQVGLRLKFKDRLGDFSGSAEVKTPHFQHRGHRFDPWSGN